MSETKENFIRKANLLMSILNRLNQQANMDKTKFMIINGEDDEKYPILLNEGTIKYTKQHPYLGTIITDSGNIKGDIDLQIKGKKPKINIKLNNFCFQNKSCPISIKYNVLDACIKNSL